MKLKTKIVYGIAGGLAFLPLFILVLFQSMLALKNAYDDKLIVDANKLIIVDIVAYDGYNNDVTNLLDVNDSKGKPVLFSIIEASNRHLIINFHGGKVDGIKVNISAIQFITSTGEKTELLSGIVYLQFKNVTIDGSSPNWARDSWVRDFVADMHSLYREHFEQPAGTIPYIWLKIISASIGTIIGLATVLLVILRKSTKAMVKRYWRIAVLVALIQGTIILGLIAWLITDIFQVFFAATIGWVLFLSIEKFAQIKGYLDNPAPVQALINDSSLAIANDIDTLLNKYRT